VAQLTNNHKPWQGWSQNNAQPTAQLQARLSIIGTAIDKALDATNLLLAK